VFFEDSMIVKVGFTYLMAIMSPGPSILAIIRNSLFYSRVIGVWTAFGTVTGIAFQCLYVLLGIRFLHSQPVLAQALQILCATYLIYLGVYGLFKQYRFGLKIHNVKDCSELDYKKAFRQGFLIDALNPLALTFFLGIFSIFIPHDSSFVYKIGFWFEIVLLGGIWFIGASVFAGSNIIKTILHGKLGQIINISALLLFIFLGLQLLVSALG
jgi:threonine/homoserine/homoserine lactone efflux protein